MYNQMTLYFIFIMPNIIYMSHGLLQMEPTAEILALILWEPKAI